MSKKLGIFLGILAVAVVVYVISTKNIKAPENQDVFRNQEVEATSSTDSNVSPSFSLAEVAKHAVASDCWMAIEGKVYNVTEFVAKHPGGPAIIKGCGIDATVLFETRPDGPKTPHPESAEELLPKFYIGNLK